MSQFARLTGTHFRIELIYNWHRRKRLSDLDQAKTIKKTSIKQNVNAKACKNAMTGHLI